jgi:hypothetical protein
MRIAGGSSAFLPALWLSVRILPAILPLAAAYLYFRLQFFKYPSQKGFNQEIQMPCRTSGLTGAMGAAHRNNAT